MTDQAESESVLGKRNAEVLSDGELDALLAARCAARLKKDFVTSDRLRDELRASGMQIQDKEGVGVHISSLVLHLHL